MLVANRFVALHTVSHQRTEREIDEVIVNTVMRGFKRDPRSRIGFQSANRASTDAISALENWKLQVADREYQVHQDTDDELVVVLSFDFGDTAAGPDLDAECARHGVVHMKVEAN